MVSRSVYQIIKNTKKLFLFLRVVYFLCRSCFVSPNGGRKKYPKVLQLPITYRCNSKCVMCNVWRMDHKNEFSVEEFAKFIRDDIFKKIESVGINAGEPSLVLNLPEYAEKILNLPSLKYLNIISNGFIPQRLLLHVQKIYDACKKRGILFHVSISLDGIGKIHDAVRGRQNVFEQTIASIDEIIRDQAKYCDSYDVACTVVKQNVNYLVELDTYAKRKKYNIKYRLGIENKRIGNYDLREQYSVMEAPFRQSAIEFFHYLMHHSEHLSDRFKYYAIFKWLCSEKPKRMLGCYWQEEGITLDSKGNIYYCAVASDSLGSLRVEKGKKIFFDRKNIEYRKNIVKNVCNHCIHDYSGRPRFQDVWNFLLYMIKDNVAMKFYRFKARFML